MQPSLAPDTLELIQSGQVAMYAACADAGRQPRVTRVFGCRILARELRVVVWVVRPGAVEFLDAVAADRRIAVVASHISTFKTFQLKAADARLVPLGPEDRPAAAAYCEAFVRTGIAAGYHEPLLRSVIRCDLDSLAAVEFTLNAAYMQTPGPAAGAAIGAAR